MSRCVSEAAVLESAEDGTGLDESIRADLALGGQAIPGCCRHRAEEVRYFLIPQCGTLWLWRNQRCGDCYITGFRNEIFG